jgi:hypothetical protein
MVRCRRLPCSAKTVRMARTVGSSSAAGTNGATPVRRTAPVPVRRRREW